MKVLVVSPGGMGCTFLMERLGLAGFTTNSPYDTDTLKHRPNPTDQCYTDFAPDRIIYVWNDPLLATLSLARRGWLSIQHHKLGGKENFNSLEELWAKMTDHDVYGFYQHWANWAELEPFQFDWRSRDGRLEWFLGDCPPLIEVKTLPRAKYDFDSVPARIKEIFYRLDLLVSTQAGTNALPKLPQTPK